jgi:hypothetical protein
MKKIKEFLASFVYIKEWLIDFSFLILHPTCRLHSKFIMFLLQLDYGINEIRAEDSTVYIVT